jgi:CubicO group peptidase (beta-lactamase class C family)
VKQCVAYPDAPPAIGWEGGGSPRPGFGWWNNSEGAWKHVPRDAYCGAGAGHQILLVVPSLELIVVRNGTTLAKDKDERVWAALQNHLLDPLMDAVTDPPAGRGGPATRP